MSQLFLYFMVLPHRAELNNKHSATIYTSNFDEAF